MKKIIFFLIFVYLFSVVSAKEEYILHRSYSHTKGKIYGGAVSQDGKYIAAIDKKFRIFLGVVFYQVSEFISKFLNICRFQGLV